MLCLQGFGVMIKCLDDNDIKCLDDNDIKFLDDNDN